MFKQSKSDKNLLENQTTKLSARIKPRNLSQRRLKHQETSYCMPMPKKAFKKLVMKKYSKSPRPHKHSIGCLYSASKSRMSSPQPLNTTPRHKLTWKSKQNVNQSNHSNKRDLIGK